MRTYSITEAARILGVSTATVSRRLAPERATRGRSAGLSVKELTEIAAAVRADPEALRRRVGLEGDFAPGMPVAAVEWANVAVERRLEEALSAHRARIPDGLLARTSEVDEPIQLDVPWGELTDWEPVTSEAQLRALLPPLEQ